MRYIIGVRIIIIIYGIMIGKKANKPFEFDWFFFCLSRSFYCRRPRRVSFGNYFTIDRTSLLRVKYVQSAERYYMNHIIIL